MTAASLREFVADTPADEDSTLAAVHSVLSQAFTVTEQPGAAGSGTHRRTWLDTFDWRLYKAGLTLQFEQARRGGRLLLSKADGTPQAEQDVTSWPRRPPLDLPEGPVRDRIIVLISPRALLPIVRAVSTATRRSCRNSVSMSRSTPSTFSSMVSSSRSSSRATATGAGMVAVISASTPLV